jgi:hypothetical protein
VTLLQAAMARAHTQRQRNKPQRTMQGPITLQPRAMIADQAQRPGQNMEENKGHGQPDSSGAETATMSSQPLITTITRDTFNPNHPHGHSIGRKPTSNILRIYHQNIRGAKTYQNWNRWKEGIQQLSSWDVGIASLVETNTNWNQTNKSAAQAMAQSITTQTKLSYSGSTESTETDFQPGGTASVALGKWTGRITGRIVDSTGLGRWSGFKLQGKGQKSLIVLSAYRPTQSNDPSDRTCHSQQWRLLRARDENNPNPRKTFIIDLKTKIKEWQEEGSEIIIGIDANESILGKNSQIAALIEDTNLEFLVDTTKAPATYIRGTRVIDFIIGTPSIKRATVANGYLPFYAGAWDSDHRALFVDIDVNSILGTVTKSDIPNKRILQSSNIKIAQKFLTNMAKDTTLKTLYDQIAILKEKRMFTINDKEKLERIDEKFTQLLLQAEQKCKNNNNQPWSEVIHQLDITYKYWKTHHKGKQNKINIDAQKLELTKIMKQPNQQWQGDEHRPPKHQLIRATKTLQAARKSAWEHRLSSSIALESRYKQINDRKSARIVKRIRKAETRRRCLQIQKSITKPQSASGGLSHILIQNHNELQRIDDKETMHAVLHNRNIGHFSQAQHTPCVIGPVATLLEQNGVTDVSTDILERQHDTTNLPTNIAELCTQLQRKRQTQSAHMPLASMIEGFSKWRESTTTSPSGKHLGIYRTLTRAYNNYYDTPLLDTANGIQVAAYTYKQTAMLALTIQWSLINLAIKHNHTYRRWLTIHNFFLEKIPGHPLVEKLRVIHIYEADWNLLLKYFIAYKVHGAACRAQTIQPEQTGGRPGKSAAHTAALTTITAETITLQKLTGATIYNDAKACFDRIIENISNATLISEGLNPKIAELHANTLSKADYVIKTKQGIHDIPNGHLKPAPFFGTGQGAADSMPRWSIQSDLLIRLYNAKAISEPIICPISKALVLRGTVRVHNYVPVLVPVLRTRVI